MAEELEAAIDAKLGEDYRFIDAPSPDTSHGLMGRGTIYWVGPIQGEGDRVSVPASYLCGGLCAAGQTEVVERSGTAWKVTGATGSSWIS